MRLIMVSLALSLLVAVACGGNDPMPVSCTGATCTCPAMQSCDFSPGTCGAGGSCTLTCNDHNTCNGSCSQSCSFACQNGSTCTVTVGASGSVNCTASSTCHVTCTGSCSVGCAGGSTCDLTCSGATSSHAIPTGGQCP